MNFQIKKSALVRALTVVSSVIKRSVLSEMDCVKITASKADNLVLLAATGLDAWSIESVHEVKVEADGTCLINARTLKELLNSFQGEELAVSAQGKEVALKSDEQGAVRLAAMDPAVFPVAPTIGNRQHLVANFAPLARLKNALPDNDLRMNIFGVLITHTPDGLVCYASNGKVAGRVIIEPEGKTDRPVFLPATNVMQVAALGRVAITQEGNWIFFESPTNTTAVKGMSVEPAPFQKMFEMMSQDASAKCDREDLLAKLASAHCLRKSDERYTNVTLTQGEGGVGILVNNSAGSFGSTTFCKTDGNWGNWNQAIFPTDNLLEYLNSSKNDIVKIHFGDPKSAIKLSDGQCDFLVMPMRPA